MRQDDNVCWPRNTAKVVEGALSVYLHIVPVRE
jgi:hypothetical protein